MTDLNIERLPVVNGFPTVRDECPMPKSEAEKVSNMFGGGVEFALPLMLHMAFFAACSVEISKQYL